MGDYLSESIGWVTAWDAERPRTQQKELGWSDMGSCRSAIGYELAGEWATDDPDTWAPIKGTVFHKWFAEEIRAPQLRRDHPGLLFDHELEVSYRGVPGHADEVLWNRGDVTDWKFTKLASLEVWDDPEVWAERRVQGHGYAAGVVGTPRWRQHAPEPASATVRFLLVPVDGKFSDWQVREEPFDRDVADQAVDRYEATREAQANGEVLPQDKPEYFCRQWCQFYSLCRGGPRQYVNGPDVEDPELAAQIEAYGRASEAKLAADATIKRLRPVVEALPSGTVARGYVVKRGRPRAPSRKVNEALVEARFEVLGEQVPYVIGDPSKPSLSVGKVQPAAGASLVAAASGSPRVCSWPRRPGRRSPPGSWPVPLEACVNGVANVPLPTRITVFCGHNTDRTVRPISRHCAVNVTIGRTPIRESPRRKAGSFNRSMIGASFQFSSGGAWGRRSTTSTDMCCKPRPVIPRTSTESWQRVRTVE